MTKKFLQLSDNDYDRVQSNQINEFNSSFMNNSRDSTEIDSLTLVDAADRDYIDSNNNSSLNRTNDKLFEQLSCTSISDNVNIVKATNVDSDNLSNLYSDPNPRIIRCPAKDAPVTYTQNIKVRFLQPPPLPPPGPLIIKEVRPPQPPPLPPLRMRICAPPPPQPPPLILRERPPAPPKPVPPQTIIRKLKAEPVPPRSVIVERHAPAPSKPRDVIIERWIPYGPTPKRQTIVQRAPPSKEYPKPYNIIIQYDPSPVRILKKFQKSKPKQEDPKEYIERYGETLLDTHLLLKQARTFGIAEDLSPTMNSEYIDDKNVVSRRNSSLTDAISGRVYILHELNSVSPTNTNSSSSSSNFYDDKNTADYNDHRIAIIKDASSGDCDPAILAFNAADLNKDGKLDVKEFCQFINYHLHKLFGPKKSS